MIKNKAMQRPVIYILPLAKIKLDAYVRFAEGEISGLGKVGRLGREELLIEDILLFDQECTPSSTKLDQGKIADFLVDMIESGEDPSCIRLWWHSHADIGSCWSAKDDETICGFNNEWMVSLVTNFAGDYLCRVDAFVPVQMTVYETLFRVYLETPKDILTSLQAEVTAKVKFTKPKVVAYQVIYPNEFDYLDPIGGSDELIPPDGDTAP